jgi:hypothetical protein
VSRGRCPISESRTKVTGYCDLLAHIRRNMGPPSTYIHLVGFYCQKTPFTFAVISGRFMMWLIIFTISDHFKVTPVLMSIIFACFGLGVLCFRFTRKLNCPLHSQLLFRSEALSDDLITGRVGVRHI